MVLSAFLTLPANPRKPKSGAVKLVCLSRNADLGLKIWGIHITTKIAVDN